METIYTAIAETFELLGTLTMVLGFIIALALAAVPFFFVLISNASDAAAQSLLDINGRIFHVS